MSDTDPTRGGVRGDEWSRPKANVPNLVASFLPRGTVMIDSGAAQGFGHFRRAWPRASYPSISFPRCPSAVFAMQQLAGMERVVGRSISFRILQAKGACEQGSIKDDRPDLGPKHHFHPRWRRDTRPFSPKLRPEKGDGRFMAEVRERARIWFHRHLHARLFDLSGRPAQRSSRPLLQAAAAAGGDGDGGSGHRPAEHPMFGMALYRFDPSQM